MRSKERNRELKSEPFYPLLKGGCDDLYRKCCDSPIFISENARTIAVEHWAKSPGDTIVFVPVDSLHAILGGGFDFTRLNQAGITGGCVASHGDGRKILVFRAYELKYDYDTGGISSRGASSVTFTLRAIAGLTPPSSIISVADEGKQLQSTAYYGIDGVFVGNTRPTEGGVYVQVSKYANGSVKSTKVLVE